MNPYAKNYGRVVSDIAPILKNLKTLSKNPTRINYENFRENDFTKKIYFCSSFFSPDSSFLGSSDDDLGCSAPEASRSLCIFL